MTVIEIDYSQEYTSSGGGHSATQANYYANADQTPSFYLHVARMQTFVETSGVLTPLVVESVAILDSVKWRGCKGPEMIRNHLCTLIEWIEANHPDVIELNNLMLISDNSGKRHLYFNFLNLF